MILLLILIAISIFYLFFLGENLRNYGPRKIIYYASDVSKVGPAIVMYLQKEGEWPGAHSFIELGGGLAPVLRYVGAHLSFKNYIAVEWARSLIVAGRLKNIWSKTKVTYVRAFIEDYSLTEPAILYCYLSEEIMTTLHQKGTFKGCLVFCLTFKITGVEASSTLDIKGWQSPLRVYDFR